jgi:hypothetical protein
MAELPFSDLDQAGPTEKDFTLGIRRYDSLVISTELKVAIKGRGPRAVVSLDRDPDRATRS